ncbi:GAF and ANTAR domain-containing protein [Streptomyces sp. B93]|uniref:GAF and ANTAR domain-containing protein n=1 Tax=Streptomyces sp. B93 TaxID=2824875 RepID=UPI001B396F3E|nr:GAF and ANTAR domain-containing protein [Streptomyces sp. B93]MBQ1092702.1 GAF and ANTAR domain-containing protein [Streptomyces sp. B93]
MPGSDDPQSWRGRHDDPVEAIAEGVRGAAPAQVPQRLCGVAARVLPVTGASVSLCGDGLPVPLGASDSRAAYLMDIQATLGDGPCLDAARTGTPVLAPDLTAGPDPHRWPVFAQQATEAGVRAVYALPLGAAARCLGTFDLYRDSPGELAPRELHTAHAIAAVMTVALMALPYEEENGRRGDGLWLTELATDHDEVYQATGMIMAQLGIGADEALARLRAHAFAQGRTILGAAHEVVAHRTRFDEERP